MAAAARKTLPFSFVSVLPLPDVNKPVFNDFRDFINAAQNLPAINSNFNLDNNKHSLSSVRVAKENISKTCKRMFCCVTSSYC